MAIIKKNGYVYGNGVPLPISTTVNSGSTDLEMPTSKAVYDAAQSTRGFVELTQSEYDAIPVKDENTLYCITDEAISQPLLIKQKIFNFSNTAGTGWTTSSGGIYYRTLVSDLKPTLGATTILSVFVGSWSYLKDTVMLYYQSDLLRMVTKTANNPYVISVYVTYI